MYLIETQTGETDKELRAVIDAMLASLADPPKAGWWHPYELGRLYGCSARKFREFVCPAGSVMAHLMVRASKTKLERALMTTSTNRNGQSTAQIITNCKTLAIDAALIIQYHDEQT